ncbi:unnamed protein product [Lasius platythorax]|uniref:Uncharacterized protein n=1 Tax=Lasius platythorax TaxID=488582 RepID=A0AAV2N4X4_9HYME
MIARGVRPVVWAKVDAYPTLFRFLALVHPRKRVGRSVPLCLPPRDPPPPTSGRSSKTEGLQRCSIWPAARG